MTFRVTGLSPSLFSHLVGLSDEALARLGARRQKVTACPGFPDRIALRDLAVGESVILVNHMHQDADTPYRASHAIFVSETATEAYDRVGEIPPPMRIRPLSLRAFTAGGEMIDADLAEGDAIESTILRLLAAPNVAYLHAHYAKRGCYAARVEPA
jgi:hypothetical protein